MSDFEAFYKRFPRRVKPFNARKAYDKAILLDTHEAIMGGLERFIRAEPWHGDIQFCPHPASWLNAGEWLSEYEAPKENYGFQLEGGEGPNLTAFIVNGIWRDEWGAEPESVSAAKAKLDELNAPRHGLKVVR